jgi:hypothetical protein
LPPADRLVKGVHMNAENTKQREIRRSERKIALKEQLRSGSLTIRKATADERRAWKRGRR